MVLPWLAPVWKTWLCRVPSSSLRVLKSVVLATRPMARMSCWNSFAVERGVAVVGRLDGEFAHALEVVADGAECAFGGLDHGDAVVGVADGLGVAFDHRGHAIRDGQPGGVVFGAVDAQPRGEPLQALGEGVVGFSQVVLRVE